MIEALPQRSSATIIVKAAPRVGQTHGELVCCAGIDPAGFWVRLYPVAFRTLEDAQKFRRWDVISYDWRLPRGDERAESRRVEHKSLSISGCLNSRSAKENLIAPLVVSSLGREEQAGKSFAFIRPRNPKFSITKKDAAQFEAEKERFIQWHRQETEGLFGFMSKEIIPYEPAPYSFKYSYEIEDGKREGTCQDWEIEATFLKWRRTYGEEEALKHMSARFGDERWLGKIGQPV